MLWFPIKNTICTMVSVKYSLSARQAHKSKTNNKENSWKVLSNFVLMCSDLFYAKLNFLSNFLMLFILWFIQIIPATRTANTAARSLDCKHLRLLHFVLLLMRHFRFNSLSHGEILLNIFFVFRNPGRFIASLEWKGLSFCYWWCCGWHKGTVTCV